MIATTGFMQTLTWSLLHFLWQGAAIAAVAAAFMVVLRKPATRYLVGITALALMLCSFVVTFAAISEPAATVAEFAAIGAPAAAQASSNGASAHSGNDLSEERAAISSGGGFAWIARGWLLGVFVFALRIAFGLFVLEQLRRRNLIALPEALVVRFRILQHRLGIRRVIQYCECHSLNVPAVIGFFRPVVLLPVRALTGLTLEQLEAVIAHELAHIKRFDVAVNFFQVIAETLFSFIRRCGGSTSASAPIVKIAVMMWRSPSAAARWDTHVPWLPWKPGAMCRTSPWPLPEAPWRRASRAC